MRVATVEIDSFSGLSLDYPSNNSRHNHVVRSLCCKIPFYNNRTYTLIHLPCGDEIKARKRRSRVREREREREETNININKWVVNILLLCVCFWSSSYSSLTSNSISKKFVVIMNEILKFNFKNFNFFFLSEVFCCTVYLHSLHISHFFLSSMWLPFACAIEMHIKCTRCRLHGMCL